MSKIKLSIYDKKITTKMVEVYVVTFPFDFPNEEK
jgi:hypothetical protein